jgi:hypothetical protein
MRSKPNKLCKESMKQKVCSLKIFTRLTNIYPTWQNREGRRTKLIKSEMKKGHNHTYQQNPENH